MSVSKKSKFEPLVELVYGLLSLMERHADELARGGRIIHSIMSLCVQVGITEGRIAELVNERETKVKMWLRSPSQTPIKADAFKKILTALKGELYVRWREELKQSHARQ